MKTTLRNTLASVMLMACSSLSAQQKITDRASLSAAALAPASDVLGIVDVSAGVAGSKKITIDDLFTGWGTTTAGATLMKAASAAAQRSALGLGTAATTSAGAYEPSLGTPGTDGFLLSSTTAGVRSWVAPASGGNVAIASEGEAEVGTDNT